MLERIAQARRNARERVELTRLAEDCRQLLGEKGESNSVAIASRALDHYRMLSPDGQHRFFEILATDFDPDPGEVLRLAEQYAVSRSPENLIRLTRAAEPPRQELLRRLNRAPSGTATLVGMRAALLERVRGAPELRGVDADFEHLLNSWFNPGFLRLERVDWSSPALLLEKLIQHEAVHEIDGWSDLRRRLEPDRRCFAFFHPALPGEPLIFVEVALLPEMPAAIAPLLDRNSPPQADERKFKVAAFYSISNCQPGLRGVNLGNFLIKQVAERLQQEFPQLRTFCTLSPIPSFAAWLSKVQEIRSERLKRSSEQRLNESLAQLRERHGGDFTRIVAPEGVQKAAAGAAQQAAAEGAQGQAARASRRPDEDRLALARLCAFYLTGAANGDAQLSDPVARFHLNNGARLERINLDANLSRAGIRQSLGLMVNYLYDLEEIEANHERFVHGEVAASKAVASLV